jgi:hypothetical protein
MGRRKRRGRVGGTRSDRGTITGRWRDKAGSNWIGLSGWCPLPSSPPVWYWPGGLCAVGEALARGVRGAVRAVGAPGLPA